MEMAEQGCSRIAVLDVARGVALLAMASFHFTYDLQFFGLVPGGTTATLPWAIYARLIAGSFFFLAGASLWLGHGRGIRWAAFWWRFARIVAGAVLVTSATYAVDRSSYVFFGILHSIAMASLIGLAFLRVPIALTLSVAAFAIAAPSFLRTGAFDTPWLGWLGLANYGIRSVDFEPLFPWIAPFLAGIAAARIADKAGVLACMRQKGMNGPVPATLGWAGQHSLLVYLLHQPVLIALAWAFAGTTTSMG